MPQGRPVGPDPENRSDRNREALDALRSLAEHRPRLTDEETDAWIREIRLERQASTRKMLERLESATEPPVATVGNDSDR